VLFLSVFEDIFAILWPFKGVLYYFCINLANNQNDIKNATQRPHFYFTKG